MPNLSIVANTQFKNRSFDDLLSPLAMYTQEFNSIEEATNELATKASVWENMANAERDPIAYQQYKSYAEDLRKQAENLSNGLTPNSRRDLLDLKRRYASEIVPIEQAYTTRKAQADEQRKAMLQNPTLLLSRRADMTSLDKYLENPQLGYDSYSGALLTQQVGQAASTLAKELRDYGNGKSLSGFTRTWLQQHGYTAAEVAQAINNPDSPESSQVLGGIVNNVIADSGIARWADTPTLNQAYSYARQGLWNAVGQTQMQTYTDEAAKLAAQEELQKRLTDYKLQQMGAAARRAKGNLPIFSDTITSPDMEGDKGSKLGTYLKNYLGTLRQDGNGEYVANVRVNSGSSNPKLGLQIINGHKGNSYSSVNVSLPMADKDGGLLSETEFAAKGSKLLKEKGVILNKEAWENSNHLNQTYEQYVSQMESGLHHYYQVNLGNFLKEANLDSTPRLHAHSKEVQRLNIADVRNSSDNLINGYGPYRINAIELRFGEGRSKNKDVFEGMMPNLAKAGDKTHLKEVKRISPDGNIELDTRDLNYDAFIKDGKAVSTPTFWRINTNGGKNGILIKMDGKTYFASGDYLGNTFRESNVDVDALVELQRMKSNLISRYGEEAYYSSNQGLKIEEAMDQYGAASVRGGSVSLSGGYKLPGYSLIETSEDQLE